MIRFRDCHHTRPDADGLMHRKREEDAAVASGARQQ
jgi:hypothetical protein